MLGVLKRNREFRRFWLAQVVSELGDWMSRVAVLALIGSLGAEAGDDFDGTRATAGVGLLFAGELAIRLLPATLWGPLAGPLADRMPRRMLMIVSDVVRAALVLLLLFVDEPGELGLLYTVLVAQMSMAVFFQAARQAGIPSTVRHEDLHEAYTLTAATWSTMLGVGALVGAFVVRAVGVQGLFVLDSATYLLSALFLVGLKLPPVAQHPEAFAWRDVVYLRDVRRGWDHVKALGLAPAVLAKTFWGAAGGYLVLLSVAGLEQAGPELSASEGSALAATAGFATGLLYGARGLGTGVGPFVAKWVFGSSDRALRTQVSFGFLVGGLGYAAFGMTESLAPAFVCVALAHMGGSSIWVGATTWWQRHVDDAFRGRVFACEFLAFTVSFTAGGALAGVIYDTTGSLRITAWTLSTLVILFGLLWTLWAHRADVGDTPAESAGLG